MHHCQLSWSLKQTNHLELFCGAEGELCVSKSDIYRDIQVHCPIENIDYSIVA